jgi:FtsH-binding integral membrane protein
MKRRADVGLYVLNLALLGTHQCDAVAWREWDVFGVPGGLGFFLVFNLAAMLLLGAGLASVATGGRAAALACAATGLVTCGLHAVFLHRDRVAFWSAGSLTLLLGILVTSLAQGALALRRPRAT